MYIKSTSFPFQIEMICEGVPTGFFQGDVKLLSDDMQTLKPSIFPCVPRLMNRIYDKITAGVKNANPIKRAIFNTAFNRKKAQVLRYVGTYFYTLYSRPYIQIMLNLHEPLKLMTRMVDHNDPVISNLLPMDLVFCCFAASPNDPLFGK